MLLFTVLTFTSAFAGAIKVNSYISLKIEGVPPSDASEINGDYWVYADGAIKLPYLNALSTTGKIPQELAEAIGAFYIESKIFKKPVIQVEPEPEAENAVEFVKFISERGVKKIPFKKGMTLQLAVTVAGGFGEGDIKRFVFIERGKKTQKYDLKNAEHRRVQIQPNDILRVIDFKDVNDLFFSPPKDLDKAPIQLSI